MSITLEDCQKIIYNFTNDKTTAVTGYVVSPISEAPMGFLGDHYKLQITHKNSKGDDEIKNFFLKTLPTGNENHAEYVLELGVFQKEAFVYKNLLGDFQSFHTEPVVPKSYLIKPENCIVLEDLSLKGYRVLEGELSMEHWKCVMKTMARLHASTVIFEEQRSINGKEYRLNHHFGVELMESTFVNRIGHPRYRWAKNTAKSVADSMKLLPNYDHTMADKFYDFATTKIYAFTEPSKKYRNVITHADLWKNNIMFNEEQGNINCVFVDYQLARYAPAAFDVLTTLHLNASSAFLKTHITTLLGVYHMAFRESLEKHGIKVGHIMSLDDFLESVVEYTLPALVEATMFATIIYVGEELSSTMLNDDVVFEEFTLNNRSKYVLEEYKKNARFREKFGDVLERLVKYLEEN